MVKKQEKKRFINRLETRKKVRPMVDKIYSEGVKAAQEGRPVAWCMWNMWQGDMIMRAMGITPVFPENYGTVCAAQGIAQKYQALSDAEGFPNYICGYARNTFGYTVEMKKMGKIPPDAPLGGMPEPSVLVGCGLACDTRVKWFQSLRQYFDAPVWTIEMPVFNPAELIKKDVHFDNILFMKNELLKFIEFLEGTMGARLDMERIEENVDIMGKVFRVWWEANQMRKATPSPMHARDFWTMMVPCMYLPGEPISLELYQQVYDEIKMRVEKGIGCVAEEKYRLTFAELPPWHSLDFFDSLAERGWNFVIESSGYHAPRPLPPSWEKKTAGDPLGRLAMWVYWNNFEALVKAHEKGDAIFGDFFAQPYYEIVQDFQVDGFIAHSLLTCRATSFWLTQNLNVLKERLGLPGLLVEGDIVDFTIFDPDEVLRQADAFESAMDHYRLHREKKTLTEFLTGGQ